MKRLVILGSGTGGTIMAAKMRGRLPETDWEITLIDRDWEHHYQPGWLFIPSGRGWEWLWNSPGPWAALSQETTA